MGFAEDYIKGVKKGAGYAAQVNPITANASAGMRGLKHTFGADVPAPSHPTDPVRERSERRVRREVGEYVPDVPDVPDPSNYKKYALLLGAFILLVTGLSSTTFNVGGGR